MRFLIAVASASILLATPGLAQTEYSRREELPPVHISQADLIKLVQKVRTLVESANQSVDPERLKHATSRLTISGGGREIAVDGEPTSDMFEALPVVSDRVEYMYRCSDAPVTQVIVQLGEYLRTVNVSGTAPASVDSLCLIIAEGLRGYRTRLGGRVIRRGCFIGGTMLLFSLLIACVLSRVRLEYQPAAMAALLGLFIPASFFMGWLAETSGWFPAFAMFRGDVAWYRRHADAIGAFGAGATISIPLLTLLVGSLKRRGQPATTAPRADVKKKGGRHVAR
ncbi:MAG: hypothetical protein PVJ57_18705 [Phycisphaerae bacterium]|jgi:hypothetical protein